MPPSMYWPIAAPGWVCQVSGGLPPCSLVCSTACALPPPPPATAPFTTLTPGFAVWKPLISSFSAASSDPEVHQENTSSELPGWLLLAALPPPPHAVAARSTPAAATAMVNRIGRMSGVPFATRSSRSFY